MLLRKNVLVILVFAILQQGFSQSTKRQYESFQDVNGKIEVSVSDGKYVIVPYTNNVVHTTFYPQKEKPKSFSYAVANDPQEVHYQLKELGNKLSIDLSGVKIDITKKPFQISYFYNDELLVSENKGYIATDTSKIINLVIGKEDVLYGGGARVLGMNRRGHRLQLYNRAHYGYGKHSELMNYTLPMFISSKKFAMLFDNASAGFLDLDSKKDNSINYETMSGTMNYFVVAGKDWYELLAEYTNLTGRQPLPPRWAFGNFSSRFGYHSQAETESTIDKYFKDNIPVDAVILDIYWFGKEVNGAMGNLEWYRDSFPNPEKMIADLRNKGVRTVLITEPFILTTSNKWQEAVDEKVLATNDKGEPYTYDFFFGNTGLLDVYDENAKLWFWNIYKRYINQGIEGWWGDLGEPEVHPGNITHAIGSGDEVHNAYGHEWAKIIYDGYKKDFPDQRPFILMRAGYAGSQRYGMIPWTGDVGRNFEGLYSQPEISLQMGMQGIAYMHSDLGGFAGGDSLDNELYTRWLQYGVFQPIFRPHAQEAIAPEPVFQIKSTKARVKRAIELRYKLKPYIYNMAFENFISGKPLMIPLFFNEPGNPELLIYDKAYMWGDAFLVSPVKERGKKKQKVYFPKGNSWIDFYTGEVYSGGKYHIVSLTMEHIPTFIKGGSFIPMKKIATNEDNYSLKNFDLHYYYDAEIKESDYQLYNDNGKSTDFLKGKDFGFMKFRCKSDSLNLKFSSEHLIVSEKVENINLIIHNLDKIPTEITKNGNKLKTSDWSWNKAQKILTVRFGCTEQKEEIEIVK